MINTTMMALHLLFGAIWVGGVLFVTVAVFPPARAGDLDSDPFRSMIDRLSWLSRASAVILFVTGGHLAGTRYTVETLTGTGRGHLVLTMLALWFVLIATVEIGSSKVRSGLDERKLREPAHTGTRWFQIASIVGVLVLLVAALLNTGAVL